MRKQFYHRCVACCIVAGICSFSIHTAGMTADQKASFGGHSATQWLGLPTVVVCGAIAPSACSAEMCSQVPLLGRAHHFLRTPPSQKVLDVHASSSSVSGAAAQSGAAAHNANRIPEGAVDETGHIRSGRILIVCVHFVTSASWARAHDHLAGQVHR